MTLFDTSIAPRLMHDMRIVSLSVPGDICKGTGEIMDDEVAYRQQVSFCGKPRCRKCQQGIGHGPYWFSYQVVDGRIVRKYVGKNLPSGVKVPTSQTSLFTAVDPPLGKEGRTQQDLQIGRSNQSPLVGRKHELHLLQQVLIATERSQPASSSGQKSATRSALQTLEMQHPQCVVLMGEGGIGKTRLAEEVAREVQRRGWAVIWSYIYAQESGIPYRLWAEALRRIIIQGLWQEQDLHRLPHMYEPLKALLPEIDERVTWKDEKVGNDAPGFYGYAEQALLWEAVYELLTIISAKTPLMVVLDDVQWADTSSCELAGYLARRLQDRPIVLLMTCRENELVSNHPLRSLLAHMQREHVVEMLRLKPLTDDQVGELVGHLPQQMVQHIQTQAAGNPFFAEELAHSFRINGARSIESDAALQHSAPEVLPGTVTAALHQRLNKLSEGCRQLLSKAAVLGGPFGFHLLSAMEVGDASADEDVLFDLLEEALRSGVLSEEGTGAQVTYHFWHPLLAGFLYNQLSSTRRARLHRSAAVALQRVYAAKEGEQAASIMRHLIEGGADEEQIAHYAALAGNHAYLLSAYPEAERYYRLAVEEVEKVHARRQSYEEQERLHLAFMLERLAECARIQGNFKEARHLFERVLNVRAQIHAFDSVEEARQEAQMQALLYSEIGWTWRFTGEAERTLQCYERAEQVLRAVGILEGPAWARLRFQQSSISWQQGNYEEALRVAWEALHLFEESLATASERNSPDPATLTRIRLTLLGDPVDLGRTYALLGALTSAVGRRSEALEHLNMALAIYERYDRHREIAHVSNNIGYIHLKKAEYTLAKSFLQRAFSLAERIGDVPLMSVVFHNLGDLAAASGDVHEAETFYTKGLLLAEQVEDREYISLWNCDLAEVLLAQGKLVDAQVCVAKALKAARAIRNTPCLGLALVALGNVRIAQAKPETTRAMHELKRARSTLQRALAFQGLEIETRVRGHLALAEVLLLMGQQETARGEATIALEEARRFELTGMLKDCEQLLEKTWS
ncbi:MAG TPA: tetratricopeptide repeat protein [Ktedonobacteraceae bacterium]|nr:tetratricopeptide repeat protein [Ktedonobacteraceae bacterium]